MTTTVIRDESERGRFAVHRSVFVDDDILRLEHEHIFDASWIYAGHASEVPAIGDAVSRTVAGRGVVIERVADGSVKAHRTDCGHRAVEQAPMRADAYRGFVFVTFGSPAPLVEYLADARYLIDLLADQSPVGLQVAPGRHDYSMNANWKLLMENGVDGQHGMTVHQTYFEMMSNLGTSSAVVVGQRTENRGIDLGAGHAMTLTAELGSPFRNADVNDDLGAQRAERASVLGAAHAELMFHTSRNVNVFPNLVLIDVGFGIQIRTLWPTAPGHTLVSGWQLWPADATDAIRRYRLQNALTFWGPAGLATPDDLEALEQCQRGFAAVDQVPWTDLSRGIGRPDAAGGGELPQRAFWRRWNELLNEVPYDREGARWDTSYLADAASV